MAVVLETTDIPRVKEVAWSVCSNAITVRSKLRQRRIDVNPSCPFCGLEEETVDHVFLKCQFARCCWFMCSLWVRIKPSLAFQEFITRVVHGQELWVVAEAEGLVYVLWEARNKLFFEEK